MPTIDPQNRSDTAWLGPLDSLPVVPATQLNRNSPQRQEETSNTQPPSPFVDDRQYRLCKVVMEHPLLPSSRYAKLASVSSRTLITLREQLLSLGYLRQQTLETGQRGRSSILLEVTPAGEEAMQMHEQGIHERS